MKFVEGFKNRRGLLIPVSDGRSVAMKIPRIGIPLKPPKSDWVSMTWLGSFHVPTSLNNRSQFYYCLTNFPGLTEQAIAREAFMARCKNYDRKIWYFRDIPVPMGDFFTLSDIPYSRINYEYIRQKIGGKCK